MSIQRVSSYIPSASTHWKYDVFLSFSKEDTRKSFTDHLNAALSKKGITVFRDDKELERGKSISPGLFKIIEASRLSIIIFSENYAYSTWCLDELVKIVECKNESKQLIFPIFCGVGPTELRRQTGKFQEALAKHEEDFGQNLQKVQKWRHALEEVTNLPGWVMPDSYEVEFIDPIVMVISRILKRTTLSALEGLVGMNSHLENLISLIDISSYKILMIGICGMGGIGKTTIARVVYDLICDKFEGICFLENVRERSNDGGLIHLQKELLSQLLGQEHISLYNEHDGINMIRSRLRNKKVLVVVDDVSCESQLNKLVGEHSWFGLGSRIIITTRDEHLLKVHMVNEVYKPEPLDYVESLQLFSLKAFNNYEPSKDYVELSERVVKYAGGIPLALEVLGSFLHDRTVDEWKSALERLNNNSETTIASQLKTSFDDLRQTEKEIFLDIACFFNGWDKDYVTKLLEGCNFNPAIGIQVLIEKSLISIDHNRLWMHNLLQQMGQQIVERESIEPEKRSRLWKEADIRRVLLRNRGTNVIEGIVCNFIEKKMHLSARVFSKMTRLRLLKINNVQLPKGLEYLPNTLRLLEWQGYPLQSFPPNFQLENIVELDMQDSNIKQLWWGIKHLNMLKVMRLRHWQNLIRTPDFTGVPNLELLILTGCERLQEVHPSLLIHEKLAVLNMGDCKSLKSLPGKIDMKSLKELVLIGCSKLEKFPEIGISMKHLLELFLDGTAITELPLSIEYLHGLVLLSLKDCKNLKSLPATIGGLKCLKTMNLSGCSKLNKFPEIVESMVSELFLDGTDIRELPLSIKFMAGLVLLSLKDCKNLKSLPKTLSDLKCLKTLNLSGCSQLKTFPEIVGRMECLSELFLGGTAIEELPLSTELLSGLVLLNLNNCNNLVRLPSTIHALKSLKTLNLSNCPKLEHLPKNLGKVESLEELDIRGTAIRTPTSSVTLLKNLQTGELAGHLAQQLKWKKFQVMINLKFMSFNHLNNLSRTPDFTGLPNLEELNLEGCTSLREIDPSLFVHEKLLALNLTDCTSLTTPTSMIAMKSLRKLILSGCANLRKFPEIVESMEHLSELFLDGTAIEELPESVELLTELTLLNLNDCKSLVKLPSNMHYLKSLQYIKLSGCSKLENLPDNLGKVESLEQLDIKGTAIGKRLSSIFQQKNFEALRSGVYNCSEIRSTMEHLSGKDSNVVSEHYPTLSQFKPELTASVGPLSPVQTLEKDRRHMTWRDVVTNEAHKHSTSTFRLKDEITPNLSVEFDVLKDTVSTPYTASEIVTQENRRSRPEILTEDEMACPQAMEMLIVHESDIKLEPLEVRELAASQTVTTTSGNTSILPVRKFEAGLSHKEREGWAIPRLNEYVQHPVEKSIKRNVQNIFKYVNDAKVSMIGVHGIGGIGKTTVLKALINEPKMKNMFNAMILVTVSRYWNTRKIQNEVLRQLSLTCEDYETDPQVAEKLLRDTKKKKLLLVLDDVWEQIDLEAVGIPVPSSENECKIIVASRELDVCQNMNVSKVIELETLPWKEAWKLFDKEVGRIIHSPDIQPFARAVVKSCCGLPLLIIVTARALMGENNVSVWEQASKKFSLPGTTREYHTSDVIQRLKFSFDQLKDHDTKSCFLYCGLFPEDREVNILQLIEYCIQEGIISGTGTCARKRGRDIVRALENAYLLQVTERGNSLRMHGLIRDLTLGILSSAAENCPFLLRVEGNEFLWRAFSRLTESSNAGSSSSSSSPQIPETHQFLLGAGADLSEPPPVEEWEQAKMIFLMDNKLRTLHESPSCPNLLALFLQRNLRLRVIPPSFFESMTSLKLLNLSKTRINSLPKTIVKLQSLKILILRDCERLVTLPSEVGSLEFLEVLDLCGTEIEKLPDEIGQLASLRYLEVFFYGSTDESEYSKLPPNLISRGTIAGLEALETLSIVVYPEDERWYKDVKSIITEVNKLTKLSSLCFHFPEVEHVKEFLKESAAWKDQRLTKFKFVVGHDVDSIISRVPDSVEFDYSQQGKCFRFVNGEKLSPEVLQILARSTAFYLDHHLDIDSLSDFEISNINGLKFCIISECVRITTVVNIREQTAAVFPSLENLNIHHLWNLRCICKGIVPGGSFAELRILLVHTCPKLEYIFTSSMIRCLTKLKELAVEDCPSIRSIILEGEIIDSRCIMLPGLKKLTLHYLPELVDIWRNVWPSLEYISFYDCPQLKKISMDSKLKDTLIEIKAEKTWWDELQWEDIDLRSHFEDRLTLFGEDDM